MPDPQNNIIEVTIESLSYGGRGVARHSGVVVFVPDGAPGDKLRIKVTTRKKNFWEGKIIDIIEPSVHRIEPPCPLFSICGGCTWQHVSYEEQIKQKSQIVTDSLKHIAGLKSDFNFSTIAAPQIWQYRNKMEMTFGLGETSDLILGFHRPGSFHEIFDVPVCLIQPEDFNVIVKVVRDYCRGHQLESYNPRNHTGFLRHLIMRKGVHSGDLLVILLTTGPDFPEIEGLLIKLREACPSLKCFIWGINAGKGDVAKIDSISFKWGDAYIAESIGSKKFRVSDTSFFQTNSTAVALLYEHILKACELHGTEIVLDAYCGSGGIGIYLADHCSRVIGIDESKQSIWDARENAKMNNLKQCTYLVGEMRKTLPLIQQFTNGIINRVIVDPPRGGMDKSSLRQLLGLKSSLLIYVSCNPTTMSRDVAEIIQEGYSLETVQPIDMFPHTYHVETILKFKK